MMKLLTWLRNLFSKHRDPICFRFRVLHSSNFTEEIVNKYNDKVTVLVTTAESLYYSRSNICNTKLNENILRDEDIFLRVLLHEINECYLIKALDDISPELFKASVTHYMTVYALDEPNKEYVLPF